MRSAVLFMLMCGCAAAQTSAIDGVVIDSVTRQPVPGVHISLRKQAVGGIPPDFNYGAMSQRDGRFSIANLPSASYLISVSRAGYVWLPNERDRVALKPGEQRTGFIIEITERATIAGRVTDEYGDPVENIPIQAIGVGPTGQAAPGMAAQTDERGQFRMIGPPGKYQIKADVYVGVATPEIRRDGIEPAVRRMTWYPASGRQDGAAVVEAAAGRDVTGIDIRLMSQRSFTISGHMTGIPARTLQEDGFTAVSITTLSISHNSDGPDHYWLPVKVANDGSFSLPGLAQGRYQLVGRSDAVHPLRSAPVEVTLDNAAVDSVVLKMREGEVLAGIVEVRSGDARPAPVPRIGVHVAAQDYSQNAETGPNGAFHFDQVFPNKFRVTVQPLPEDLWLKTIHFDDKEVPGGELDLSGGVNGGRLEITLSPGAGQIEGRVVGDDGSTAGSESCFVILSQGEGEVKSRNEKLIQSGEKFQFTSLAPGKYRLMAVALRDSGTGADVVKTGLSTTVEIEIHEGDRVKRDVKLTALGGADAAK